MLLEESFAKRATICARELAFVVSRGSLCGGWCGGDGLLRAWALTMIQKHNEWPKEKYKSCFFSFLGAGCVLWAWKVWGMGDFLKFGFALTPPLPMGGAKRVRFVAHIREGQF